MNRLDGFRSLAVALLLAGAAVAQESTPASPGVLGAGGRISWTQSPLGGARTWVDAQAIVRPLPRLFLAGSWGRSEEDRRGAGPDTSITELRWDLALGVVLLQGSATGYVPLLWRHCSERHSWWGDSRWTEIGTGIGTLWPIRDWLQMRGEILWTLPTRAHDELLLGPDRQVDGSRMELSIGFIAFVR